MTTLRDVAEELGLSISTVSRALNGHPHIDERTRKRIRQTAARLNYQPNVLARALRNDQTKTIGLVIPDILNQFYAAGATILQSTLRQSGYRLIVCISNDDPDTDRECLLELAQHRVDGIVHVPCTPEGAKSLRDSGVTVPIVELNRCSDSSIFDAVIPDDREGAFLLAQHLIALGHRRIGVIAGNPLLSTTRSRLHGFDDAIRAANLKPEECPIVYGDYSTRWGKEAAEQILQLHPRPTAIFATGNQLVLGALQALEEANLVVPGDVSLIGFDDPEWCAVWRPAITTYALPLQEMGLLAGRLLLDRMRLPRAEQGMPTISRVSGRLMIRQSSASPAGHAVVG